jgi:site-specific DNA-methyltransferase (adenine-specific)
MSTDVGDVVLDPFLGTGTTAIAAKTLQRQYIGIEMDENYARIAEDKLSRVEQTTFKEVPVSMFLNKIQTLRDIDAQRLFPPQLTSTQKKQLKYETNHIKANGNGKGHELQGHVARLLDAKVIRKTKQPA